MTSVGKNKEKPSHPEKPPSSPQSSRKKSSKSAQAEKTGSSADTQSNHKRSSLDSSADTSRTDEASKKESRRGKRHSAEFLLSRPRQELPPSGKSGITSEQSHGLSHYSIHSQVSVGSVEAKRLENDDSTHSAASTASVRGLRRSIQAQNDLQVPPAFRAMAPPSARDRVSTALETHSLFSRGERGSQPGGPALAALEAPRVDSAENDNSLRSTRRPPIVRPSLVAFGDNVPTRPRSRDRIGGRRSIERLSLLGLDHDTSALQVRIIDLDPSYGDKTKVGSYNNFLESIVNSERPETQRGLDVLATMERDGVVPDERTWKLIDRCSQLREESEHEDEEEHDDIVDSQRKTRTTLYESDHDYTKILNEPIQRVALYSSARATSTDGSQRRTNRLWKEQDLALMPPAFRSSILAMLRRKGAKGSLPNQGASGPESVAAQIRKQPAPLQRTLSDPDCAPDEFIASIADRKKVSMPVGLDLAVYSHVQLPNKSLAPNNPETTLQDEAFARVFKMHGIVKYMRPEGHGEATRLKSKGTSGTQSAVEYDETAGFAEALEALDESSGPSAYSKLLSAIARSESASKASVAGKVVKKMKSNSVAINHKTKLLLAECLRIREPPPEPKPHELEMEEVLADEANEAGEDFITPAQTVRKRVRFADTDSFRYIRRRRSIGSNERWDDPLTPPKRMSVPVDLAPGRFSSSLRDDRPSLPRRTYSMSSLQSASSHSAHSSHSSQSFDRSSSSSDTIDSLFEEEGPNTHRFKLPFADSPEAKVRKRPAEKTSPREGGRPPTGPSNAKTTSPNISPQRQSRLNTPTAPVRSSSNDLITPSKPSATPAPQDALSPLASIPPPPSVDDPTAYRTPSPKLGTIKRRRSISSTEKRSDYPLTPPRRVSAPLDIFIAQESLKARAEAEKLVDKSHAEAIRKNGHPTILEGIKSITIADNYSQRSPVGVLTAAAEEGEGGLATTKPLRTSTPAKGNRREDVKTLVNASKRVGRKVRAAKLPNTAHKPAHSVPARSHADPKRSISPLMRHKEKVSEHWKRMEFRDRIQIEGLDDGSEAEDVNAIQWSMFQNYEGAKTMSRHSSAGDSAHAQSIHRSFRGSRRNSPAMQTPSSPRPRTKPSEDPPWHHVLSSAPRGSAARQGENSSDHGARTAFSRRMEQSKQNADANMQGDASQQKKRRAARRSSVV